MTMLDKSGSVVSVNCYIRIKPTLRGRLEPHVHMFWDWPVATDLPHPHHADNGWLTLFHIKSTMESLQFKEDSFGSQKNNSHLVYLFRHNIIKIGRIYSIHFYHFLDQVTNYGKKWGNKLCNDFLVVHRTLFWSN